MSQRTAEPTNTNGQLNASIALERLPYFVSWGGEAAVSLMKTAVQEFIGRDLKGQRILEIGAGRGKMSIFFALLGAEVLGVDVERGFAKRCVIEARKWGVEERVRFIEYDGCPASLTEGTFDLLFTKSVLLYVRDIEPFLREAMVQLRPQGRACFLENMCRGPLDVTLRGLIHWYRGERNYHYMNARRLAAIGRVLALKATQLRFNPLCSRTSGWYLICGNKPICPKSW